jgi:2-polyprenyl-3-methyl-5-hydroxy-6-metoxy-1,4-benzoquinol methylase
MQLASRGAYEKWHQLHGIDPDANAPWHRMLKPLLASEPLDGKTLLEIGCGRGDFSCWLAKNTRARTTAADMSAVAIGKGREFGNAAGLSIDWELTDIQSIAHPSNCFDYVISCETIEHVQDPQRAVKELARVLKPGGKLFLTTPNYLNLIGLYRGYLRLKGQRYTETGQPINRFVLLPRTIRWIRTSGLRILRAESRGLYLPIPGRPWTLLDTVERPRSLTKWIGLHSLAIAQKVNST